MEGKWEGEEGRRREINKQKRKKNIVSKPMQKENNYTLLMSLLAKYIF